jgi:hypothetical protein
VSAPGASHLLDPGTVRGPTHPRRQYPRGMLPSPPRYVFLPIRDVQGAEVMCLGHVGAVGDAGRGPGVGFQSLGDRGHRGQRTLCAALGCSP